MTTPNEVYTITFDIAEQSGTPEQMIVSFGGTQVADLENFTDTSWREYTYMATAMATSSVLSFQMGSDPGFVGADNVIVTASTSTPEPATWGLVAGSAALAALLRRRFGALSRS